MVTGVSGSGKTTLVLESLVPALEARIDGKTLPPHVRALDAEGIAHVKLCLLYTSHGREEEHGIKQGVLGPQAIPAVGEALKILQIIEGAVGGGNNGQLGGIRLINIIPGFILPGITLVLDEMCIRDRCRTIWNIWRRSRVCRAQRLPGRSTHCWSG